MRVSDKMHELKQVIPSESKWADAIRTIVELYRQSQDMSSTPVPERTDVKQLWRILREETTHLLVVVAKHSRDGIAQEELEHELGVNHDGLKGLHNGLSRICKSRDIDPLIQSVGYNRTNRRYYMNPDVARTILTLQKRHTT